MENEWTLKMVIESGSEMREEVHIPLHVMNMDDANKRAKTIISTMMQANKKGIKIFLETCGAYIADNDGALSIYDFKICFEKTLLIPRMNAY